MEIINHRKVLVFCFIILSLSFLGCASVPMASVEQDMELKEFKSPASQESGLYIYRNSFIGAALKKSVYLDNKDIGESANGVYFYTLTTPGTHMVSTESEFNNSELMIVTEGGKNYFVEQIIKMGVLTVRAKLRLVDEETGKKSVLKCRLAKDPKGN